MYVSASCKKLSGTLFGRDRVRECIVDRNAQCATFYTKSGKKKRTVKFSNITDVRYANNVLIICLTAEEKRRDIVLTFTGTNAIANNKNTQRLVEFFKGHLMVGGDM